MESIRAECDTLRADHSAYRISQEKERERERLVHSQERVVWEQSMIEQRDAFERDLALTRHENHLLQAENAERESQIRSLESRLSNSQAGTSSPVKSETTSFSKSVSHATLRLTRRG